MFATMSKLYHLHCSLKITVAKVRIVVTAGRWREADATRNGCLGASRTGGGLFLNLGGGFVMSVLLLKWIYVLYNHLYVCCISQ